MMKFSVFWYILLFRHDNPNKVGIRKTRYVKTARVEDPVLRGGPSHILNMRKGIS